MDFHKKRLENNDFIKSYSQAAFYTLIKINNYFSLEAPVKSMFKLIYRLIFFSI